MIALKVRTDCITGALAESRSFLALNISFWIILRYIHLLFTVVICANWFGVVSQVVQLIASNAETDSGAISQ